MTQIRMVITRWAQLFFGNQRARAIDSGRWLKYAGLALLSLVIIGFGLYESGGVGPPKVVGIKVEIGTLKPTVFGIGTVQAKMNYNVGSTQTGKILKLYVDQGDSVKAGQVIGEIDPVDLEQRIISSRAALVSSQHDVEITRAQIQEAESRNQLAKIKTRRYTKLFEGGTISRELLETKENDETVARSALDSAISTFQSAQSKVAKANADYQGQIEQKRNLLLISPVDGIVVSRQAEAGSTVVAGQAVYNIIDPKTLWVHTRIDQTHFSGVALDQPAEIVLRSQKNDVLRGKIVRLELQSDTVTEESFADVKFSDTPTTVFLGDLAEVTIRLPEVADCLYIPVAAIKRTSGRDGAWVVQNNKAYFRAVTTGVQTTDGNIQIIDGLVKGETVVLYSKSQIAEGMGIRLVSAL